MRVTDHNLKIPNIISSTTFNKITFHLQSTTQVGCDFEYINEADRVCGRSSNCLSSVRANMRMLRDSAGPQIGLKECLKIPCLYRLLKDINKR